jgi:hypothetical protein
MKMKRIDAVIKGKATQMTDTLTRKAARILRNVDQAIDWAEDQLEMQNERAEALINSLGTVADGSCTRECSDRINSYIDTVKMADEWKKSIAILNNLKEKLNAEVEVEEEKKDEK